MTGISGFVLAGGHSSRMGTNKALMGFGKLTLLERALVTLRQVCPAVRIVGPSRTYAAFGDVIEDIHPDCGPLGGIHSALNSTHSDCNLIISVDMPLMTAEFLTWLAEQAAGSHHSAVVPEALGRRQPLCAVYAPSLLATCEQALRSGEYKIGAVLNLVATRYIKEQEISTAGFSSEIFHNVNTKEELALALQQAAVPGDHVQSFAP